MEFTLLLWLANWYIWFPLVVGTSIWMAYDAAQREITVDDKPYTLNNGSGAWFFYGLLLWIVAFPHYLVKRSAASLNSKGALSSADELIKYKQLLDQGVISLEEFELKKKKILA